MTEAAQSTLGGTKCHWLWPRCLEVGHRFGAFASERACQGRSLSRRQSGSGCGSRGAGRSRSVHSSGLSRTNHTPRLRRPWPRTLEAARPSARRHVEIRRIFKRALQLVTIHGMYGVGRPLAAQAVTLSNGHVRKVGKITKGATAMRCIWSPARSSGSLAARALRVRRACRAGGGFTWYAPA